MALDEPEEQDVVETINDINVAFDQKIYNETSALVLDLHESEEGSGLVLLGNEDDCGCN